MILNIEFHFYITRSSIYLSVTAFSDDKREGTDYFKNVMWKGRYRKDKVGRYGRDYI